MLEKLLACRDIDDMTSVGMELITSAAVYKLQSDVQTAGLVFSSDAYWADDKLTLFTPLELIDEASKDNQCEKVLHMLQILQKCCPAVAPAISKLLSRTTC